MGSRLVTRCQGVRLRGESESGCFFTVDEPRCEFARLGGLGEADVVSLKAAESPLDQDERRISATVDSRANQVPRLAGPETSNRGSVVRLHSGDTDVFVRLARERESPRVMSTRSRSRVQARSRIVGSGWYSSGTCSLEFS